MEDQRSWAENSEGQVKSDGKVALTFATDIALIYSK